MSSTGDIIETSTGDGGEATSAAEFYTGIVADVYGALRGTTFEAGRYLEFVRRVGEPALELGCGDDGPFFDLVRAGLDVEGVDSSQDMLDRCRVRAEAESLQMVTHCQPMESLELPRRYRSIYLAGPTFNLLPDDDTALRALQGIAAHLESDGEVMVPLWIPSATPAEQFGRVRGAVTAEGAAARYTVESENYDEAERTRTTSTRYELDAPSDAGTSTTEVRRDWIIHWHTPEGIADIARSAGLATETTPVQDGEFTAHLRHA